MAKDSSSTILLLGAAAVAFYGYTQGWFSSLLSSFGGAATATPATTTTASTVPLTPSQLTALSIAAGVPSGSTAASGAAAVPALGTTVTSPAQVGAQVTAKDAFILPDAATFAALSGPGVPGYLAFSLSDKGNVFLRQDVWQVAGGLVNKTGNAISLSDLQGAMSTAGLSGLGQYQRHLASRGVRVA